MKVYFPGLNGLRFIAAFAVIVTHVELMKKMLGHSSGWRMLDQSAFNPLQTVIQDERFSWYNPIFAELGPLGVVLFFVLSGFLITFLLLAEKETKGKIAVKDFYLRRIFRIWPLYYLIFILGFFILPQFDLFYVKDQTEYLNSAYWLSFGLYLIILPNLALAFSPAGTSVPNIGQSWSIGVEEQFYVLWPLLFRFAKKPLKLAMYFTIGLIVLKVLVILALKIQPSPALEVLKKFLAMSKMESMAIGGFGAYLYFKRNAVFMRWAHHPLSLILALAGIPILIYLTPYVLQDAVYLPYSVFFLIIIIHVSTKERHQAWLENPIMSYLGNISYGLYMYHMMVIVLVINALTHYLHWEKELNLFQNLSIYTLSIGLSIGLASLSYRYFEKPFIQLKRKYTHVVSGDAAKSGSHE
jgi:peptidoglycan/LPS O-acetylase OafA/YrhL